MVRLASDVYKAADQLLPILASRLGSRTVGTSAGGGGGGLTAHALDSAWHTGTLAESQAPWAVTDAEFLIHTSNPNAHHSRLHNILGIADHVGTGSLAFQIVGAPANDGLAWLTPSYDVGSTPVAAILRSTDAGGLTLGTLTVRGSVDIINNGDLTVGANVFFVDESQENVGILCSPDPQFALDINGPARATYWIGPHAIQLKDVLLLAHYDGRQPFETNYRGEPNGHMGQVATITGDVIYRPGKFGTKGVQIAEATTNLLPNPGAENNATGYGTDRVGAAVTQEAAAAFVGSYGIQRTAGTSGSQNLYYSGASALTGSATYTFSAYLRALNGDDISASGIQMYLDSSDGGQTPTAIVDAGNGWYRFILTRAVKASPGNAVVGFTNLPPTIWYTDGWQLELKAYATPYHSADLDPGGTATRSTCSLTYPTSGNINAKRGTIMQWVKVDSFPTGGSGLWCAGDANTEFDAYITSVGTITFRINTANSVQASGVATAGVWLHIACTWDVAADEAKVYLNGAQVGSTGTVSGAPTLGTALYAGSLISNNVPLGGVLDDFVVLDRVLPAKEIMSVYESDAPVFAESSRFSFRATPTGLVWADDEGLWMRAVDGDPVLGVYGGEAATKSWGGWTTMASGDLLIGAYGGNHLRWDDSEGLLAISGTVTATAGAIGGWSLDTNRLYATNISLYSGAANTARVEVGSAANTGGINTPNAGGDIAFWAGATHANRATAPFMVTAAGALTSTSGYIGGWSIASGTLSTGGIISLYSGAAGTARIETGAGTGSAGIATHTVAFWAGTTHGDRANAPFRVDFDGNTTVKWLLGGDAAGKLSLRPAPYSAGDFYLDLTTTTSQFKIPDVRIGYALTTETATLWIGKERTGDGIGQILFHSKTSMGSDFNARIYRGGGTNGVFQLTHRGTGAMQFYNYDDNDIIFYTDDTPLLNLDLTDGVRVTSSAYITLDERTTNPGAPTQDAQIRLYMKGNKFVIQYYGGNPVAYRYHTIDMSTAGTSAP